MTGTKKNVQISEGNGIDPPLAKEVKKQDKNRFFHTCQRVCFLRCQFTTVAKDSWRGLLELKLDETTI